MGTFRSSSLLLPVPPLNKIKQLLLPSNLYTYYYYSIIASLLLATCIYPYNCKLWYICVICKVSFLPSVLRAFFHVLGCSLLVILEILEYRKMQNMYPCRILIQNLWSSRRVQGYCCILDGTEAVFKEKRGAWEPMLELTLNLPNLKVDSSLLAKFIVPD